MLRFDEYAASIRAAHYCEGAIVIEPSGQEPLRLHDALPSLVTHLCFGALAGLSSGRTVTVPFFMSGVDVAASVLDGSIALSLSSGGSVHADKDAMLLALYDCGARFTRFHTRLWAEDPAHELDVANLERERRAAAAVLGLAP